MAMSEMLSFLHPGVDFTLTIDSAFRLIPLADEYQINVLKNACEDVLLRELREQIFPAADFILRCMVNAEKCSLPTLAEKCSELFSDPEISLKELQESKEIGIDTKAKIYEKRIKKMENEREITESWKHRIVSVRVSFTFSDSTPVIPSDKHDDRGGRSI